MAAVATVLLAGCGSVDAGGGAPAGAPLALKRIEVSRSRTFLSISPACGTCSHAQLDVYSLIDGRRLQTIADVPPGDGHLADPAATSNGHILLTFWTDPPCSGPGPSAAGPCRVWTFDGTHLHLVADYAANDSPTVVAVAW